jgi:SRSO17 transposase
MRVSGISACMENNESTTEASGWGLPPLKEIERLGDRLVTFYSRFRSFLRTKTRDTSAYGLAYLSGLLRMEGNRNMAEISRQAAISPQNVQHFISNSPWSRSALIQAVQQEISRQPEFQAGAVLVLDESAEQKSGGHSAGAARQHNGRLGKVEMSQVGVFLSLVTSQVNSWIDGELYLHAKWFTPEYADRRKQVELPETRTFQTKPQQGWDMIQRAVANGVPFVAVAMDDLYGRSSDLRWQLDQAHRSLFGQA